MTSEAQPTWVDGLDPAEPTPTEAVRPKSDRPKSDRPVLYVVACGGYPTVQLPDFVRFAQGQGWDVCVIATPDGLKFVSEAELIELTGHPVRSTYKRPEDGDVLPSADAFVIAPATFNTINKWANGISDTLALGLMNEALGLGLPMIAAPWPDAGLMRHPAFQRSLTDLRQWGVQVILDADFLPEKSADFPWDRVRAALDQIQLGPE